MAHDLDTYAHTNSRINNPRAGLAPYDNTPDTPHTYAFDPHMSPSLEWSGKTEGLTFTVPTTSIHKHEIIRPHLAINAALKQAQQQQLFIKGLSPRELLQEKFKAIEVYKHPENWTNRLIAGDSLIVMNSLLQKEGMSGTVQTAYIDPPYGIKYGSNFQPFVDKRDVKDKSDDDLTREPEMIKAFRDTWELGIHSYLTYLRDRLLLVKEMLKDSGSVFVQISDENVHLVRCLCDEVFGVDNFVSMITFSKNSNLGSKGLAGVCDYIIWYAKNKESMKYHDLFINKETGEGTLYTWLELADGTRRKMTNDERRTAKNYPDGARAFSLATLESSGFTQSCMYDFEFEGKKYKCSTKSWRTTPEGMKKLLELKRVMIAAKTPRYIQYHDDFPLQPINNLWDDTGGATDKRYVVQTSTKVIQRCILMTSDPGDLVLDITCGSGTTAYVAEQWGRRWITCDTSRVAIAIARQRLMTAAYDYYTLADDKKGISGGFRYKTVPHITLKSIANNEPPASETLYDAPEVDRNRIRITGPFSVEGLPAPAVLSPDEAVNFSMDINAGARQSDWRGQLSASGIIGRNGERIRFSRVDALEGTRCLNAIAETDEENPRSAVICFADETTLMDSRRVYRALEEAVNRLPRPELVIFAAFGFDAEASSMIRELEIPQGMTALQVNMNADLMTEDLKKNVRTEQSFFLVGQPDVQLVKSGDKYRVKVIGFDYYNIKTNEIESGEEENIAMWLLDTDYDTMTLKPSQIFFPLDGKSGGWNKLARTLRTEIDPELIAHYAGNESLPFEAKEGQKIAVKIIDDRGIESMRVIEVR